MPDRNKNPAPFTALLKDKHSILGKLCQHAEYLSHLEKKLCLFLDSPLNTHCNVANYINDTLVLHSDSAAWAAKLRYNIPVILNFMQNECDLITLKTIRIKIKLSDNSTQPGPDRKKPVISRTAALLINQAAATITDDELRSSLLKLVKNSQDQI